MINTHSNQIVPTRLAIRLSGYSRYTIALILLTIGLFVSALVRVYVSDLHRQLMIREEALAAHTVEIHHQFGQLLQQQSQLSSEMNIAQEAKEDLAMVDPDKPYMVAIDS